MLEQYVVQWYELKQKITKVMTGIELEQFIKTAVIKNKDVRDFSVTNVTK